MLCALGHVIGSSRSCGDIAVLAESTQVILCALGQVGPSLSHRDDLAHTLPGSTRAVGAIRLSSSSALISDLKSHLILSDLKS